MSWLDCWRTRSAQHRLANLCSNCARTKGWHRKVETRRVLNTGYRETGFVLICPGYTPGGYRRTSHFEPRWKP